jgi:hypothetical protein
MKSIQQVYLLTIPIEGMLLFLTNLSRNIK